MTHPSRQRAHEPNNSTSTVRALHQTWHSAQGIHKNPHILHKPGDPSSPSQIVSLNIKRLLSRDLARSGPASSSPPKQQPSIMILNFRAYWDSMNRAPFVNEVYPVRPLNNTVLRIPIRKK